jgi:predicted HicB family RNase H-like nuclease
MLREGFAIFGPYKGFYGRAEYDQESNLFHGQIIGTRDVITFQGKSTTELEASFPESIDDYLSFCESRGESPEKPYSGKFMLRIDPELHRRASTIAAHNGISLNQFVADCIVRQHNNLLHSNSPLVANISSEFCVSDTMPWTTEATACVSMEVFEAFRNRAIAEEKKSLDSNSLNW